MVTLRGSLKRLTVGVLLPILSEIFNVGHWAVYDASDLGGLLGIA